MSFAAIILIFISAMAHSSWNLIGKRESPTQEFFLLANAIGCMCLVPVVIVHSRLLVVFPLLVWIFIILTGVFQAMYYSGLAGAYMYGNLSIGYPLVRSGGVLLVVLVNLIMGKSNQLTTVSVIGMALVIVGSLILPVQRLSDWKIRDYLCPASLFALLAAIGTTGYSIVDDAALRNLLGFVGHSNGRLVPTLCYAFFEGVSTSLWLLVIVAVRRGMGIVPKCKGNGLLRSATLAGIGIYLAYTLVLIAMTMSRNVAYVVAFRQLGIPIVTVLGIVVLHEPRYLGKVIGIITMLAGLLMVALK